MPGNADGFGTKRGSRGHEGALQESIATTLLREHRQAMSQGGTCWLQLALANFWSARRRALSCLLQPVLATFFRSTTQEGALLSGPHQLMPGRAVHAGP